MDTITDFESFKLLPSILRELKAKGYQTPTPIQIKGIPPVLLGKDLLGMAQTGSGKTAAFSLPILEIFGRNPIEIKPNCVRSLILSPTRELASQIEANVKTYGNGLNLKSIVVYGGVGKQPQIDALKSGIDVLVATPGRLLDLIDRGHINFEQLEIFVLDEADMMLDMGFLGDVKKVISFLPKKKQTLLFSATMPSSIKKLSESILITPEVVEVDKESSMVDSIKQILYTVEKSNKGFLLQYLLENPEFSSVLVFCKTKFGAERLVEYLEKIPVKCATIHSNKTQTAREEALNDFREGKTRVLVATDIAARGIDISHVSHVINHNLPEDPKSYIHRIGRTGRAGREGVAISFVVESEAALIKNIGKLIKTKVEIDSNQPFHKEFSLSSKATEKPKKGKAKSKRRR